MPRNQKIPQTLSRKFGEAVRQLRVDSGITQEVFAEQCGFFRTYLSRIESGKANPTLNAIEVIAVALGCRPSELLAIADAVQSSK
jgi:transcriptional regulator with XRE-family HTH domain